MLKVGWAGWRWWWWWGYMCAGYKLNSSSSYIKTDGAPKIAIQFWSEVKAERIHSVVAEHSVKCYYMST